MGKLKYTLISLLAICLTVGGVFAAWTFSEGIENPDPVNIETNINFPESKLDFDYVRVTFDSGEGTFENGITEKYFNNLKSQSISYVEYNNLFPGFESYPTKSGEAFSHWIQEDGTMYHFDEPLNADCVLTAQYVPSTNPALHKIYNDYTTCVAYFDTNPDAEEGSNEYYLNNFISEDRANWSESRNYFYGVLYNGNIYECKSTISGTANTTLYADYVYDGLYTILFRETAVDRTEWKIFGGNTLFQRRYDYNIVGTPTASWDINNDNPMTFGYVSETEDKSDVNNPKLTKTYKIEKAYFPKSVIMEGEDTANTSREFKIGCPYFAGMLGLAHTASENTYKPVYSINNDAQDIIVYSSNDSSANLKISNDCDYEYFDITIDVVYYKTTYYYDNESGINCDIYVYDYHPDVIYISAKPYEYAINFYDAYGNICETEMVGKNMKSELYDDLNPEYNEVAEFPINGYVVDYWVDMDTGYVVDFANVQINRSYDVRPEYKLSDEFLPQTYSIKLIDYTSESKYDTYTIPIYDGHSVASSLEYYEENNLYTTERGLLDLTEEDYKTVSGREFYFNEFAEGSLEATSSTNADGIRSLGTINKNYTYYIRYIYSNALVTKGTDNSTILFYYESMGTYDFETNREHLWSGNAESGNKLLGYNKWIDPASSSTSYNLITSSGLYFATKNTSDWTIVRAIYFVSVYWWTNDSCMLSVKSGVSSVSSKYIDNEYIVWDPSNNSEIPHNTYLSSTIKNNILSSGRDLSVYLVDYTHKKFQFCRRNGSTVYNSTGTYDISNTDSSSAYTINSFVYSYYG